ncbi:MAG: rod shape-determining protein MreD [Candidatus Doudnabacteria bacterium]|nr:rod shape-determining protein MreD [Candidatus Doudnabacteria bacterium]
MNKQNLYQLLYLFFLFLIYVAGLKVFTGHPYLVPQLVFLSVIIFAVRETFIATLWYAFAAGFLLEFFSGFFFGANLLAMVIIALAAFLITRNVTSRRVVLPAAATLAALGTAIFPLVAYLYLLLMAGLNLTESVAFADLFSVNIIWAALLNVLFFYPVKYAQPVSTEKYN